MTPLALDGLEQRLERRAAVDEDRRPAGLVREEEGVREPGRVHAPLDDHQTFASNEPGLPPSASSVTPSSPARACASAPGRRARTSPAELERVIARLEGDRAFDDEVDLLLPVLLVVVIRIVGVPGGPALDVHPERGHAEALAREHERPVALRGSRGRRCASRSRRPWRDPFASRCGEDRTGGVRRAWKNRAADRTHTREER